MSNHEITFNTDLSEPVRTRADFSYEITPAVISIVDTGLGKCSVTDDILPEGILEGKSGFLVPERERRRLGRMLGRCYFASGVMA